MQRRRRCAVAEREDKKVCSWCIRAKKGRGRGWCWMDMLGSLSEKPEAQSEADTCCSH